MEGFHTRTSTCATPIKQYHAANMQACGASMRCQQGRAGRLQATPTPTRPCAEQPAPGACCTPKPTLHEPHNSRSETNLEKSSTHMSESLGSVRTLGMDLSAHSCPVARSSTTRTTPLPPLPSSRNTRYFFSSPRA